MCLTITRWTVRDRRTAIQTANRTPKGGSGAANVVARQTGGYNFYYHSGVAVARVHPAKARDKRLGEHNDLFADRRPEMYKLH
jgi:hypothetical protein